MAGQGTTLDVRGWPADCASAAGVRVTDLREPVALRRAREAFERAYERELYRRQVGSLPCHTPAAA